MRYFRCDGKEDCEWWDAKNNHPGTCPECGGPVVEISQGEAEELHFNEEMEG